MCRSEDYDECDGKAPREDGVRVRRQLGREAAGDRNGGVEQPDRQEAAGGIVVEPCEQDRRRDDGGRMKTSHEKAGNVMMPRFEIGFGRRR